MYGFNHLPPIQNAISVTEFYGNSGVGSAANSNIVPYVIPKNATFLYVVLIGRGADGGIPSVGAGVSGGGGGGSSAITKALIPTMLLTPVIFASFRASESGAQSCKLLLYPEASSSDSNYAIIGANNGRNGAGSGTGGVAGVVMTTAIAKWSGTLALWVSQAGAAGGAGSTTNGAAVTALATLPLTGGGGGGGSSAGTGGNVTGAGPFPTISGGASGANPGNGGMMLRQPFGGVGGSGGGGSNAAGTGANKGGDGAIGCGGGGGGSATSGTAGAGGKGGPGYCLIVAF